jgi:hypothetical protein
MSWSKIQLFGFTEQLPAMEQVFLRDWQTKLDQFLQFNDRDVLEGSSKISKKAADEKACSEYIEFEKKQRLLKEAEGEKDIVGLLKWDKQAANPAPPARIIHKQHFNAVFIHA